jgi:AcrR family transcriptional regulator
LEIHKKIMAQPALVVADPLASGGQEKRAQILKGAREMFLARGFDAASMGDIARAAGVSKGTLYVYFENKERLFATLVEEECRLIGDWMNVLDPAERDVRAALTKLGRGYLEALMRPGHIAWLRTVIGAADKFPELGQVFLNTGPRRGVKLLTEWLRAKIADGELAIDDVELAAWHFLMMCQGPVMLPMMLGGEPRPTGARLEQVIAHAVDVFMAAYHRRD